MEDLVADARRWAEQKTVDVLVHSLPKQVQKTLDTLLINDAARGVSPVTWLRRYATGHSDKDILETVEKLAFIRRWDVTAWQTDELPPMRIQQWAQIARYTSTRSLRRKKPDGKRRAILVAFLIWAHEKTIDELVELFDLCLADAFRRSKRELKEFHLQQMARMQQALGYYREIGQVVNDETVPDEAVRANIYEQVPAETLQASLEDIELFYVSGRKRTYLDFFDRRYSYFRRFTPAFLQALTFHDYADKKGLLEALDVLREMNASEDKLPAAFTDVPVDFVSAQWRSRVLNEMALLTAGIMRCAFWLIYVTPYAPALSGWKEAGSTPAWKAISYRRRSGSSCVRLIAKWWAFPLTARCNWKLSKPLWKKAWPNWINVCQRMNSCASRMAH